VNKATVDDDKNANVYVLKELADKSMESINECTTIENALIGRLNSRSANVKLKALRAIQYLCTNGRNDFVINFQRNNGAIKACLQFSGPPHPLKGDKPYENVREAAKQCMNAVFNSTGKPINQATTGRIEGQGGGSKYGSQGSDNNWSMKPRNVGGGEKTHDYGHGTFSVPGNSGGFGGGGKMEGFGNYDPEKDKTMIEKLQQKWGPKDKQVPFKPYQRPSGYTGGMIMGTNPAPISANVDQARKRGQVGGVWGSDSSTTVSLNKATTSYGGGGGGGGGNSFGGGGNNVKPSKPQADRNAEASAFDRQIVDKATEGGGVRQIPTKAEITDFLRKTEALNNFVIAQLLNEKLDLNQHPVTQLKALTLSEALLNNGSEEAFEYFGPENEANLATLESSSTNAKVRAMATKVMVVVGLREEAAKPQPTQTATYQPTYQPTQSQALSQPVQAQPTQPQPVVANLLDLDFGASPATQLDPVPTVAVGSAFSFMGGGETASAPAAAPTPVDNTQNLFGSLHINATPAPTSTTDSFSFMSNTTITTPAPAVVPDSLLGASPSDFLASSVTNTGGRRKSDPIADLFSQQPMGGQMGGQMMGGQMMGGQMGMQPNVMMQQQNMMGMGGMQQQNMMAGSMGGQMMMQGNMQGNMMPRPLQGNMMAANGMGMQQGNMMGNMGGGMMSADPFSGLQAGSAAPVQQSTLNITSKAKKQDDSFGFVSGMF